MKGTIVDGTIPRLFEGKMLVCICQKLVYILIDDVILKCGFYFMLESDLINKSAYIYMLKEFWKMLSIKFIFFFFFFFSVLYQM
jgi:hypothetical protein